MDIETLTPIQKFYYGKGIFLTGVTGFLGKMLFEKILRCCPGTGTIYLLMREKRGKTPEQRLDEVLNCELFREIKDELPKLKKKIKIIYGDLEKPGLNISEEDAELLKGNVEVVFHSAARVKWDDPLRLAATCHVLATKYIMALLKQFRKLKAFLYVSTAYVHKDPDFTVPEHVTRKALTPDKLLDALEWLDDEAVKGVTKAITKVTTTYLLTKQLTENVVEDEHGSIPTAIVRPCLISPAWKDPFPGWCDTYQGMQGLMLAGAKGFLRTFYVYDDLRLNIIPADIVVNTCLATAWHTSINNFQDVFVVNCVIDYDKLPLAGDHLLSVVMSKRDKYPLASIYRYPDFTLYRSYPLYCIHAFFDHYIPAVIGDTFLFIFTGKTIMCHLYSKISFLYGIFLKFGKEPWICKTKNYKAIKSHLSEQDSKIFFMDTDDLNWEDYVDDMLYAGRKTLGKEDPSNIPYAKRKAKVWLYVTTFLKWLIIVYFLYFIYTKLFTFEEHLNYVPLESHSYKMTTS